MVAEIFMLLAHSKYWIGQNRIATGHTVMLVGEALGNTPLFVSTCHVNISLYMMLSQVMLHVFK